MKHGQALWILFTITFLLVPAATASFEESVDLGKLGPGSQIIGEAAGDEAGFAVAMLPDANGDLIPDLLIGAPYAHGTGAVYLVYGKTDFGSSGDLNLANLGADGVLMLGEAQDDLLGWAVASIGDLDGDSLTDFLISAPGHDAGAQDAGRCYLVYGSTSFPQTLDLSTLGTSGSGIIINGAAQYNMIGMSLSAAGDFGGSAFADFAIGAPFMDGGGNTAGGVVYVLFWDPVTLTSPVELASLTAQEGLEFHGSSFLENAGFSLGGGVDFDNKGRSDIIIGAPGASYGANYLAGRAYLVSGEGSFTSPVDLETIAGSGDAVAFDGGSDLEQTGYSVVALDDFNSDGFGDVAIAAPLASPNGLYSGRTYVVYGSDALTSPVDLGSLGSAGVTFNNENIEDGKRGLHLANVGDINDDDRTDLAIGASNVTPPTGTVRTNAGLTYVVIGNRFYQDVEELSDLPIKSTMFYGQTTGDFSGCSVAGGGDVDDDGIPDIIIGAHGYSAGSDFLVGRVHLAKGQDLGTVRWPHSPPTTGEGTQGQNMSFVPYMDGWGNLVSGNKQGMSVGIQVDTAWSKLSPPIFFGLFFANFTVYPSPQYLNNAIVWPEVNAWTLIGSMPVYSETGSLIINITIPSGFSGVQLYLQQLWANPLNSKNLAATNCLCLTIK